MKCLSWRFYQCQHWYSWFLNNTFPFLKAVWRPYFRWGLASAGIIVHQTDVRYRDHKKAPMTGQSRPRFNAAFVFVPPNMCWKTCSFYMFLCGFVVDDNDGFDSSLSHSVSHILIGKEADSRDSNRLGCHWNEVQVTTAREHYPPSPRGSSEWACAACRQDILSWVL